MTKADAIRRMTDKDLAEFMTIVAKNAVETLCEIIKNKWSLNINLSKCNFETLTETHQEWLAQEIQDADC